MSLLSLSRAGGRHFGVLSRQHAPLLLNAGALATGTLGAAALGFFYWWFAARAMAPEAVGYAAAAISLMNLLAHIGEVGMGPLLIGEIPRSRGQAATLIITALTAALLVSGALGLGCLALAHRFSLGLGAIGLAPGAGALFVLGCALTGLTIVLDQAFVGLLSSGFQLTRNMVFAASKLLLIVLVAWRLFGAPSEVAILGTWIAGQLLSLAAIGAVAVGRNRLVLRWPRLDIIRPLLRQVVGHHTLSIVIQAPGLLLPFIVTVMLSAETNAAFYACWTLINVVILVPASLSAVIFSIGTAEPALLAGRLRLSLALSGLAGLVAGVIFLLFSTHILGLFSPAYPVIAGTSLKLLGFASLGFVVKYHYVAVERLRGRLLRASCVLALGGGAEIAAAIFGARTGLLGLTAAWLIACAIETLAMLPAVVAAARHGTAPRPPLRPKWPRRVAPSPVLAASGGQAARAVAVLAIALGVLVSLSIHSAIADDFVSTKGTGFVLAGKPFRVAGVNNHYLTFGSHAEVLRVLDDAVAMNANVVRTFIQPVIGSADGRIATIWNAGSTADASNLGVRGVAMLSFDPDTRKMVFHDGPDGLERLDFVIAEAGKRDLKLIVALLDFWGYTGGAQQMSAWYGSSDTYTFFAQDPRTRADYKAWAHHVLTRRNTISGRAYADDPTVMAWELMNEPDIHPRPLLNEWLAEMSGFVKALAPRQLVSTGHANMAEPLTELALPSVDFGTWHGYASYAKLSHEAFDELIPRFCSLARAQAKPVLLEEFGVPRSDAGQAAAYRKWLATIEGNPDCAGWVVWRLVGRQDSGAFPADEHDGFDIRRDDGPAWTVLTTAAAALRGIARDSQ